ncbi:cupin domain-containing protein [Plantactinospora solaniradicis]|uniref:Cupin domain-containing protein n=1 Tax=Plantactinospora solaniradicis TaxID=1723736 RepID=A0ABW1KJI5_9ACTN
MGDFVIRRWELAPIPEDQAPPHVHHGSDEAFCVLSGRLEVLLGDVRQVLGEGEYLVVPAGTTHTFATVGDTGARILAVMTPEVDALVDALHSAGSEEERAAVWAAHNSAVVDLPTPH